MIEAVEAVTSPTLYASYDVQSVRHCHSAMIEDHPKIEVPIVGVANNHMHKARHFPLSQSIGSFDAGHSQAYPPTAQRQVQTDAAPQIGHRATLPYEKCPVNVRPTFMIRHERNPPAQTLAGRFDPPPPSPCVNILSTIDTLRNS